MLLFTRELGFAKLVISYLRSRILRIEEDLVDQIFHPSEKRLAQILLLLARLGRKCGSKSEVGDDHPIIPLRSVLIALDRTKAGRSAERPLTETRR